MLALAHKGSNALLMFRYIGHELAFKYSTAAWRCRNIDQQLGSRRRKRVIGNAFIGACQGSLMISKFTSNSRVTTVAFPKNFIK